MILTAPRLAGLRHLAVLAALTLSQAGASPRIVGGTNAATGEYPFIVALVSAGSSVASGQFGGGSLIAPQWVLTAGHCGEGETPSSVEVWIGGRNLNNESEGIRVTVEAIYIHPDYSTTFKGSLHNDVCLYKLATPVTSITPVPLASSSSEVAPGTNARIIGWGTTSEGGSSPSILQKADVPIVSLSTANSYYRDLDSSNLPAGYSGGGIDTCQGDSGGPLLVADGLGGWKVGGVVSFGDGCARPGVYGIYANVPTLRSWILNTMGENSVSDDHGDSLATATSFPLTSSPTGIIETSGDLDLFKIVLGSANTILDLASTGSTDVKARLLDSKGNALLSDDNSAGSPNFRILTGKLRAGTYYLEVSGHDSSATGPYGLIATVTTSGKQPEIVLKNGATVLNSGDTIDYGSLTPGNILPKDFTIENTGTGNLRISSATISGPGARDFRLTSRISTSVGAGRSTAFRINFVPSTSSTRSATLVLRTNDPDESAITLPLTGTGLEVTSDDHGDSRGTATLVSKPSSTPSFLSEGDVDYFRIDVTTRGSYTFSTSGYTDTYGTLYDISGFYITENDDSGPDSNFQIRRTLDPGTYYLAVDGYNTTTAGAYSLEVK